MFIKKLLFVLALWFLVDWAYKEKIKPFLKSEFGMTAKDSVVIVVPKKDSLPVTDPPAPDSSSGDVTDSGTSGGGSGRKPRIPLSPVQLDELIDTFKKRMPNFALRKYVYGLDISKYQGDLVELLNRRKDSLAFLICKATEYTSSKKITDPNFSSNWQLARQKYFIRGAYHFYHCTVDPILQVDFFLSVTGTFSKSDLPPVIDVEESSFSESCSKTQAQKDIITFLTELEKRTGRRPIIYTNNNTGNVYLTDPAFSKYPLWVAYYGTKNPVPTPDIWDNIGWNIWQKSESYQVQGFTSDYDVFNGGLLSLRKFIMTY